MKISTLLAICHRCWIAHRINKIATLDIRSDGLMSKNVECKPNSDARLLIFLLPIPSD